MLENITFAVNNGDFTIITGPNGGGKSTLGKIILKDIKADSGEIQVRGRVSYAAQKLTPPASLPMTVLEFLSLEKSPILEDIYNEFEIEKIKNCKLNSLSGGQLQKVNLCMAIRQNCDIIVLDEPDQNLDFNAQNTLYKLLKKFRSFYTFVIISHDIHGLLSAAPDAKVICINKSLHCSGHFDIVHDNHCNVACKK